VLDLVERNGHNTIAVTDDGLANGKLLGVVTSRDYRPSRMSLDDKVSSFMTPREKLVVAPATVTLTEANDIIWDHKLNSLPIVDENDRLMYFVFRKVEQVFERRVGRKVAVAGHETCLVRFDSAHHIRFALRRLRAEYKGYSAFFCECDCHSVVADRLHDCRHERNVEFYSRRFALSEFDDGRFKVYVCRNTFFRSETGDKKIFAESS